MKLIFAAALLISLNAHAFSKEEHCAYLTQTDPDACQSSAFCSLTTVSSGKCVAANPQYNSSCAPYNLSKRDCEGNTGFGCQYVPQTLRTCIEK